MSDESTSNEQPEQTGANDQSATPPSGSPPPRAPRSANPDDGLGGENNKPKAREEYEKLTSASASPSAARYANSAVEDVQRFKDNTFQASGGSMHVDSNVTYHNHYHSTSATPATPVRPNDPGFDPGLNFVEFVEIYLQAGCCDLAWRILNQNSAVLICGRSGNGRRMLAHHLTHRLMNIPEFEPRQLPNARPLLDYNDEDFRNVVERRIYLLTLDGGAGTYQVDQPMLDRLVSRVVQKGSFLIITCSEEITLSLRVPWRVQLGSAATSEASGVFLKHLRRQLTNLSFPPDQPPTSTIIQALGNSAQLQQIIAEAPDLRRVALLAVVVADRIVQGSDVEAIEQAADQYHASWLTEYAKERVLHAQHTRAHLSLLVASATLSDICIDEFFPLANMLREEMHADFDDDEKQIWQQLQRSPTSTWLGVANSRMDKQLEWLGNQVVRVDIMVFEPRELNLYIVDAFWEQYHQSRGALCRWLLKLGLLVDLHPRTRMAVARTVGVLLLRDRQRIDNEIIMPWLETGHYMPQEMAAIALRAASRGSESASRALLKQLESWNANDNIRPRLIFASALIFAWLSIDKPREFIRGMSRLVNGPHAWVLTVRGTADGQITEAEVVDERLNAVRLAFLRALQMSDFSPDDYEALFREIWQWSKSTATTPRRIAREVFVDLMLHDVAPPEPTALDPADSPPEACPILLHIITHNPKVVPAAAVLLGQTMTPRSTSQFSLIGIERMIEYAAQLESQPLERLLQRLCTHYGRESIQTRLLKQELVRCGERRNGNARATGYYRKIGHLLYQKKLI